MTRFASIVLPPARVEHQPFARPGIYWPHVEDPTVLPWQPTHRIHYLDRSGHPHAVEVVWLLNRDVSCTPDLYLLRRAWNGYERDQWVLGGRTGWLFAQERAGELDPHRLWYTLQGRTGLEMERLEGAGW